MGDGPVLLQYSVSDRSGTYDTTHSGQNSNLAAQNDLNGGLVSIGRLI